MGMTWENDVDELTQTLTEGINGYVQRPLLKGDRTTLSRNDISSELHIFRHCIERVIVRVKDDSPGTLKWLRVRLHQLQSNDTHEYDGELSKCLNARNEKELSFVWPRFVNMHIAAFAHDALDLILTGILNAREANKP